MAKPTERELKLWQEQGDTLLQARRFAEARPCYERILAAFPADLYVIYQLTLTLEGLGDLSAAANVCDRGLALDPMQPGLLSRRAAIARGCGQFILALDICQRLQLIAPDFPFIEAMMGDLFALLGRGQQAVEAFNRALALDPDNTQIQSDRLFVLNYFGTLKRSELFDEHRKWGEKHESALRSIWPSHEERSLDPDRKLRVGYVSADLRQHAVAYFIEGVLRNHDLALFEIHAFDVSPKPPDRVTLRLKEYVYRWHRLQAWSDDDIARLIQQLQIDVLVDLSGHTAHNRLLVFARRPAPIQVSWFGYMNTTGLTAIDYRFTDAWLDPPGHSEHFYTEQLYRLPSAACFQPDAESPDVGPLPAMTAGAVTLASLNQWTKVTSQAKNVWAQILIAAPQTRLKIFAMGGDDSSVKQRIVADFVTLGIAKHRLEVIGFRPLPVFLKMLSQVDFALDPFPYGGGTTTLHSTWMGVPMVALESESELGRSSPGILNVLGLGELVAHSPEEYRRIALDLIGDLPRLEKYRRELRDRFRASALMNAVPVTRSVEAAFRAMWQKYVGLRAKRASQLLQP